MRKVSGLQNIADLVKAELFVRLLDSLEEAQTTATHRTYVGNLKQKLQQVGRSAAPHWPMSYCAAARLICLACMQKRAAKRGKKKATIQDPSEKPKWLSSETEHDLTTADRIEPSYRCIPRILCAGTGVNAVQDAPKEKCLKDIQRLLGPYWNLAPVPFPLKGGRLFIASMPPEPMDTPQLHSMFNALLIFAQHNHEALMQVAQVMFAFELKA